MAKVLSPADITVAIPAGAAVPALDAVDDMEQVPGSYLIWRAGCTVGAITPNGQTLGDTFPTERDAVLFFIHYAYMH